LVIGAPVFCYYPQVPGPYLPEGTSLIQLTNDPDEAARAPVGDAIVADLRSAVEALLAAATSQRPPPPSRPPIPYIEQAVAPLKPETLWAAVGRAAPPDALWVSEAGSNEIAITTSIRPSGPFSHLSTATRRLRFVLPAAVGSPLAASAPRRADRRRSITIRPALDRARFQIPVTAVASTPDTAW
jgi:benzoylformate decarboxylase